MLWEEDVIEPSLDSLLIPLNVRLPWCACVDNTTNVHSYKGLFVSTICVVQWVADK